MVSNKSCYTLWIVFFLFVLVQILIWIFGFSPWKKEGFESNALYLEEFNKKYDADIVGLPTWLFALGVQDGAYNTYSKLELYAETMIEYWMENIHPHLPSKYYVIMCPMDGFGNHGDVSMELKDRIVTDLNFMDTAGTAVSYTTNEYPIFHSKRTLYAMCKNINDKTTVLLPNAHYIREEGHKKALEEIDANRVSYRDKKTECIWRGELNNGTVHNFFDMRGKDMNPRRYFQKLHKEGRFSKVNFEDSKTSITDQIKYKYILDIDGWSATWSAMVWKMYSGSVLLKTKSKWKQWYYDDLKEWEHYVPVANDYSDLNDKIEWCIHNEEECERIIENARKFVVEKLNWEQVKRDTIATVKRSF